MTLVQCIGETNWIGNCIIFPTYSMLKIVIKYLFYILVFQVKAPFTGCCKYIILAIDSSITVLQFGITVVNDCKYIFNKKYRHTAFQFNKNMK